MSQQLGILALIDIQEAIRQRTLRNNIHLMDNMKAFGSEGNGTEALTSIVPGTFWCDGTQAQEQMLNWIAVGIGSDPALHPRSLFRNKRPANIQNDDEAYQILTEAIVVARESQQAQKFTNLNQGLRLGTPVTLLGTNNQPLTTEAPLFDENDTEGKDSIYGQNFPILFDITGEAVEKKIIFQAQYGAPDLVADLWYWAASVDTFCPGTYSYTMHFILLEQVFKDGKYSYKELYLTHEAHLRVTSKPKVNGFTGGPMYYLPI